MSEQANNLEHFFDQLKKRRFVKRIFIFFKRLFFIVILLLLVCWLALQSKWVQNKLVKYYTEVLSEDLQTDVSIKKVDIEFFDKLVLEEVYIEDQKGDTLLYSQEIKADFKTSFIELFSKELVVDNIYLTNAQFSLVRDSAEQHNRLQFLIDYFKSDKKKKKKSSSSASKPFLLDVNGVYLNNVHFEKDDNVSGQLFSVFVDEGVIQMQKLDLPNDSIHVNSVVLKNPIVKVEEKAKFPSPPSPKVEIVVDKDSTGATVEVPIDSSKIVEPIILVVNHFEMHNGTFDYDHLRRSPVRTRPADVLDFNHINVEQINIDIDSFIYKEDVYKGQVNKIALKEKSGFVLNELSANDAMVTEERMELNGMKLITPYSNIGDTLVMKYSRGFTDFKNFNDRVNMTGKFNNAEVAIRDIIVFAPNLERNKFFKQNENEVVKIDGQVLGRVNKLRGKNLTLQVAGNTIIKGNFNTRDLSVRGEEFMDLKLERFNTTIQTLRLVVPGFNAPANFDKLGRLDFTGKFFGFFNDFSADGVLVSDLGRAEVDMGMNLKEGRALAKYEGKLALYDFDLKRWSGNDNFGSISFASEVKEGVGLTLETVDAKLIGTIQEFTFKDYTYNNLTLDGALKKNLFDGSLLSKDQNLDFVFNGKIDFEGEVPTFDFDASINRFDLQALNLSKKPLTLIGDVGLDFKNFKISDIEGDGAFYNFKIINEVDTFNIDTLYTSLIHNQFGQDSFLVKSDVLELEMGGEFDVQEVPALFAQYLVRNFPEFSERFNIKAKEKELAESQFDFFIRIPNSKNFTHLLDPKLDTLRYAIINGRMDNVLDSVKLEVEIPFLKYGNMKFDDVFLTYQGLRDESNILLDIYHTSINDNQDFEPLKLEGFLQRDTFNFDITSSNFTSVFDDLNLRGKFFLVDEFFQVQFLPSNLVILQDQWDIVEDNYIRFGKGFVETQNFDLQNFEKRIVIESVEGTGITMSVENFDLALINEWWIYDKLDFQGKFFVLLEAGNIYEMEDIFATAISDSLNINGDYFGELRLDVAMESINDQVDAFISIEDGDKRLEGEGFVAPFSKKRKIPYTQDFDFLFNMNEYPLSIVEYFIPNGISNTVGSMSFDGLRLYGKLGAPKIGGEAFISNMGVTIDYLQTRYTAPSGTLKVNNEFLFDASDNVIYDSLGNTATITGGIRHTNLKKLRLDVGMQSDEFIFLDTKKEDNDLYYGYGIGKGEVDFSGSFQKTDITVNATTGKGSKLNIPVDYGNNASEVRFIKFIEMDSIGLAEEDDKKVDFRGVEIDMNLEVTPEAEVWLIFDERAGDIIKGKGLGNVQLQVFRNGDIKMYGDYEIEEGQYLFTLLNNLVNKPFTVKKGGTIRWEGDPFGAIIDLEAEYLDLNTAPYNFIVEYLNVEEDKTDAKARTAVDLTMHLKGPMLQPEINFDISFPDLAGNIKNFTDSKLRLVRQDQNELNRQVFGLLVLKGFLPNQNTGASGTNIIGGINNTVSELLTNQLSIYLTEILSEVFTDVGFISGVDFKVNYNFYSDSDATNPEVQLYGSEIELGTKFDFFNDRVSLDVAGSYIDQGGQYFSGDLAIEFIITKNRRIKLRLYRVSDQTIQGRRDRSGLGLSYRREFDTFQEFLKGAKKSAKKLIPEDGN